MARYEYFIPDSSTDYDSLQGTNKCQTFVAESTHIVNEIKLKLKRSAAAEHNLYKVFLYETDVSHLPDGEALVQMGSFYADGLTLDYVEYAFNDSSYEITDGVEYAIVIYTATEMTSSRVSWWTYTGTGYSGFSGYHNHVSGWVARDETDDRWFEIYDTGLDRPTDPTPENNDTGVDFSDFILSWVDGGTTDTYNVYIGETGALTPVSVAQVGTSYITTLAELETIFSASPIDQKIYWRIDATNDAGTTTGDEWNFDPRPVQATVPSPAHEATDVKLSTTPLSYTVGDPVDIRFKVQGGAYTQVAEDKDVLLWRTPYVILNIKDYNPPLARGRRSPVAGDVLTHGDDSYTIAFVVRGDLINVEYQAKLYAFRTSGPGGKNPGDILTNGVAPDVEDPQAVRVTLNDQWHFHDDVEQIYLPPDTTFVWRVDATNDFGTTTGIEWEFTTLPFRFVRTSYALIVGGSGSGPYDYPPGEEGTDWSWTGENNMVTIKRLIVAAKNTIFIEDI